MDEVVTIARRVERALESMWSRQTSWMPGGTSVALDGGTLVMNDCGAEWLSGPTLYLSGEETTATIDDGVDIAWSCDRALAIDLVRSRRVSESSALRDRGFEMIASRHLMARPPGGQASEIAVELATPARLDEIRLVQQNAFDMSRGDVVGLFQEAMFDDPATEMVIALDEGLVRATATAHHDEGMVGIFGVGSDRAFGKSGFGSAVTMGAVARGLHRDADLCWLQAGDDVRSFYERLGFESVDFCDVWLGAYV